MRRVLLFLSGVLMGCLSRDMCNGDAVSCPPPVVDEDACEGRCAPYVGGGWEPVFVSASSERARVACPSSAPFEAMATEVPPLTACGVLEAEGTCDEPGYVCLPAEPAWRTCIVRDGEHACPAPYAAVVALPEPVTLCCPKEPPPPA